MTYCRNMVFPEGQNLVSLYLLGLKISNPGGWESVLPSLGPVAQPAAATRYWPPSSIGRDLRSSADGSSSRQFDRTAIVVKMHIGVVV